MNRFKHHARQVLAALLEVEEREREVEAALFASAAGHAGPARVLECACYLHLGVLWARVCVRD